MKVIRSRGERGPPGGVWLVGNEDGAPSSVRLASAAGRWVLAVAVGEAMVLLEATVVNVAFRRSAVISAGASRGCSGR